MLLTSTDSKRTWSTVGVSDNIIQASWLALVESFEFYRLSRQAEPEAAAQAAPLVTA